MKVEQQQVTQITYNENEEHDLKWMKKKTWSQPAIN